MTDEKPQRAAEESDCLEVASEVTPEAVQEMQGALEEYHDRLQRLQAEFQNYRKRVLRDQDKVRTEARAELLRALLPVFDDLARVLETADASDHPIYEGVEMILRSAFDCLERLGVQRVETVGCPFDPECHEALSFVPSSDVAEGCVVDEYQPGFWLQELLLRPARVTVAQRATAETDNDEDGLKEEE